MDYILVHHRVKDFRQWKLVYDEDLSTRQQAGIKDVQVLHAPGDPNDLTLLFEAVDLPKAQAFTESAHLKEAMNKAGVLGDPEMTYLKD